MLYDEEDKEEVQPVEQDVTETPTGEADGMDMAAVQKVTETPTGEADGMDMAAVQKVIAETKEKSDLEETHKTEKATLKTATAAEKSDLEKFAATTQDTGIISAINESYGKASEQYNNAVRSDGSPVTYQKRDGLAGRLASIQEGDIARFINGRPLKPSDKEVIKAMRQRKNPPDASQNKEKPQKAAKSPIDAKQMTALINMAKSENVNL